MDIARFIERALDEFDANGRVTMENILETDRATRDKVRNYRV
jgi:1-deoxy-D-xylulose 5-phosphate reductoisomerase